MSVIVYYEWGKLKPHTPRPPKCGECFSVHDWLEIANADTEHDAQLIWAWAGVRIVNRALKVLWPRLWNVFQCPPLNDAECKKKVSCGAKPTFIQAGVQDVDIPDNTSPRGKKRVWQIYVTIQRDIMCEKGDPKDEKDDPVPTYETLPEPNPPKHPGEPKEPIDPEGPAERKGPPQPTEPQERGIPVDFESTFHVISLRPEKDVGE